MNTAKYIGLDRSQTEYGQEVNRSWQPYISSGFTGALGRYIIAIGVPITNLETGKTCGHHYYSAFNNLNSLSVMAIS